MKLSLTVYLNAPQDRARRDRNIQRVREWLIRLLSDEYTIVAADDAGVRETAYIRGRDSDGSPIMFNTHEHTTTFHAKPDAGPRQPVATRVRGVGLQSDADLFFLLTTLKLARHKMVCKAEVPRSVWVVHAGGRSHKKLLCEDSFAKSVKAHLLQGVPVFDDYAMVHDAKGAYDSIVKMALPIPCSPHNVPCLLLLLEYMPDARAHSSHRLSLVLDYAFLTVHDEKDRSIYSGGFWRILAWNCRSAAQRSRTTGDIGYRRSCESDCVDVFSHRCLGPASMMFCAMRHQSYAI